MPAELSETQIAQIEADIARSGITLPSLKDDLLDHLCCLVEAHLAKGDDFDAAYRKALAQTSPNGLDEIHTETLFLMNAKSTQLMNTSIFVFGLISTILICMSSLGKIMHWPIANVTMLIGLGIFCCLYAPMWVMRRFQTQKTNLMAKFTWILSLLAGVLFTVGSIFKMLHYPGANLLMFIGIVIFSFIFLPFLFYRTYKGQTA